MEPFSRLPVGQYRLVCVLDHGTSVLEVHRIEHRRGADTADDWERWLSTEIRDALEARIRNKRQ